MKKLIFLLLLPVIGLAQSNRTVLNTKIDSLLTNTPHNNNAKYFNRALRAIILSDFNVTAGDILPKANGGTGTSSPSLVAGTNISITGSWPNQTINQSGGSGITNSAPNNHLMASDGVNAIDAGIIKSGFSGSLTLGASAGVWNLSGGLYVAPSSFPSTGATGLFQTNQINATNNTVMWPGAFSRGLSSGTAAIGIGTGIELITVNASGTYKTGATIESVSTNITGGSEAFDLVFKNMSGGSAATETFRIRSNTGVWQTLTLTNSWTNASGTTARWRYIGGDMIELEGQLVTPAGLSTTFATIPWANSYTGGSVNAIFKPVVTFRSPNYIGGFMFKVTPSGPTLQIDATTGTLTSGDVHLIHQIFTISGAAY